jgi:hypothetical protein
VVHAIVDPTERHLVNAPHTFKKLGPIYVLVVQHDEYAAKPRLCFEAPYLADFPPQVGIPERTSDNQNVIIYAVQP